jgi:predicted anti-sigma-YlaC factor YlaD
MNWLMRILKALFGKVGELSPNCREATRLQSEALDRSLGLGQRIGLRIHLILCQWCRRYGKQIGFLRSAAHRHEEHEQSLPPQSLRPEARERIKRRLREEEK